MLPNETRIPEERAENYRTEKAHVIARPLTYTLCQRHNVRIGLP
jgi:hypothetical protein